MPHINNVLTPVEVASLGQDFSPRAFRFAESIQHCMDLENLSQLTREAVSVVGMTAVASGIVSGPKRINGSFFHFVYWPSDWLELYLSHGYVDKDPVTRWAVVSGAPISWTHLLRNLSADDPGHEVYMNAAKWGFTEGFVTPARGIDGCLGLVSVGGERDALLPRECLYLQSVSVNAFHRAEAISSLASTSARSQVLSLASRESNLGRGQQEMQAAKVQALFALTPAEWRVAFALYKGESLQGVAATNRVSVNTLRVQLASVYAKTRTHRQTELVAAIRSALDA